MEQYLKAGILSVILTVVLHYFLSMVRIVLIPPFLPTFIVVVIIVMMFKIKEVKEVFVVTLMSYFFSNALLELLIYGMLYSIGTTQIIIRLNVLSLIDMTITPIMAIFAVYIGTFFSRMIKS